ncbi:MAG: hypothetical protein LBN06_10690 [Prevotellaceae bacterium]|nr:hypothetical protein [Prevotellaceae bacterium]
MKKESVIKAKKVAGRSAEILGSTVVGAGGVMAANAMSQEEDPESLIIEPEPVLVPTLEPDPVDPDDIIIDPEPVIPIEPEPIIEPTPIVESTPIVAPDPIVEPTLIPEGAVGVNDLEPEEILNGEELAVIDESDTWNVNPDEIEIDIEPESEMEELPMDPIDDASGMLLATNDSGNDLLNDMLA